MTDTVPVAHLPRLIDFSPGIQKPANIVRVTHPGTCAHCGEEIAMYHRAGGLGYELAHTGTERSRCNIDAFHISTYIPTCPACGGHDLTTNTTDPWADITTCPCGYTHRRSLGD